MRISGARTIRAEPQEIWDFILTPSRLRGCLPGCEHFEAIGRDTYAATLRIGVAFLKGTYTGTLRVVEATKPEALTLAVQGGGPLGALQANGTVKLVPSAGSTYFLYEGDAQVSGRVAAFGERVIEATANGLIGLFFDCVASHVEKG